MGILQGCCGCWLTINLSDSILQMQCRRVYEILRLRVTDLSNPEEYKSYRLEVKKRLNIPFQVLLNGNSHLIHYSHDMKLSHFLLLFPKSPKSWRKLPINLWQVPSYSHLCRARKKVPFGRSGQVDSPSGQVTFYSHLPNGQGIGKPSVN